MSTPLRAATRGSRLALRQVEIVGELLGVAVEPVVVRTLGDRAGQAPLRAIAGQGAFSSEVSLALLAGAAEIAVHSAKDLPPRADPRLELAAFPERGDPRDVLVGATLASLPAGATVATGAPRRRAQLRALRPDLRFAELRGNIETRLAKAAQFSAVVVAAAALERLGLVPNAPTETLDVAAMVPQVGQAALAVEVRAGDTAILRLLADIDHGPTRLAVTAERSFLDELGGDCDLPAGAHAMVGPDGVDLRAFLAGPSGLLHRSRALSTVAEKAGQAAAFDLRVQLALAGAARVGAA